jgi:LysM repeat protein
MTSGIRLFLLTATLGLACIYPAHTRAQDAVQTELQALRKLIEQQNEQIARLSTEVARLGALLEGHKPDAATPNPAPPGTADAPRPPVVPPANVHIVVKGDSLEKIAKQHNILVTDLQKLNKISDPKKLQIGQQLTLPPNADKPAPDKPSDKPSDKPAPAPDKKENH